MLDEQWEVELSEEVAAWYLKLSGRDRMVADHVIDLVRTYGPHLGMPHSKPLGDGLRELRFACESVARRITYYWDERRRAFALTTFRKQRQSEQREIKRATKAMRRHKEGNE